MSYSEKDAIEIEKLFGGRNDLPTTTGDMYDCSGCGGPTFNVPPKLCDKCQGVVKDAILSDNEKKLNREYARNKPCPCGSTRNFKNCHGRYKMKEGFHSDLFLFLDGFDVTDKWTRHDTDTLFVYKNAKTREEISFNKTSLKLYAAKYN